MQPLQLEHSAQLSLSISVSILRPVDKEVGTTAAGFAMTPYLSAISAGDMVLSYFLLISYEHVVRRMGSLITAGPRLYTWIEVNSVNRPFASIHVSLFPWLNTLDSLLIGECDTSNGLCERAEGCARLLGSNGTAHGVIIDLHRIARVQRGLFDEAA
jgi:hypothetical protein